MSIRVEGVVASRWTEVEVYATYMKLTGEVEVTGSDRLSDVVNGSGRYLSLRDTRAEPLSVNYPVLSRVEPRTTIAKSAVILICPLEEAERERIPSAHRAKLSTRPSSTASPSRWWGTSIWSRVRPSSSSSRPIPATSSRSPTSRRSG